MSNDLRKHVFLVDDEPDTCQIVSQILGDLGLRVTCFSSGRDCLKQLRAEPCNAGESETNAPLAARSGHDRL